jgi:protein-glutamine gamma-glutamyltransferase
VSSRARELEALALPTFAAVPLYLTRAIGFLPLILFHVVMLGIAIRVASGRGPDLLPARLMRWIAIAYVPFYILDAVVLSRSAIAASTHLVLFIAAYQPSESAQRQNHAQRMLTAALIAVASLATSTHITIVLFVIGFAFLMFRQLVFASHAETMRSLGRTYAPTPSARAALFYLAGAALIGALLFPLLPRVRNPFMQGLTGALPGATTALSDTIDFREPRVTPGDATIVARIWMNDRAAALFTPVRLRGMLYDHWDGGQWTQTFRGLREVVPRGGVYQLDEPGGDVRDAVIQLRPQQGKLYLPAGTFAMSGITSLYEGPSRGTYYTYQGGTLNFDLHLATQPSPLRPPRIRPTGYPIRPEIAALAHGIIGNEQRPERRAQLLEQWMLRNFRYVPNPATPDHPMTVDDFLLHVRAGHCEYFAAGMVVLLTAVDVPARIAGGFYGGRYNPLARYYTLRREDAHAWTEVWDGSRWRTFDATPPSLRPGSDAPSALSAYFAALADSVTYIWDRYVLTFGLSDQIALFSDLFTWMRDTATSLRAHTADAMQSAGSLALPLALIAAMAMLATTLLRRRPRLFDLLARALAERGITVGPSMTIEDALRDLRARDTAAADALVPLAVLYEEAEFSRDRTRGRELRRLLEDDRKRLRRAGAAGSA